MKLAKKPLSAADQKRAHDASLKFYAAAAGKEVPPHLLHNVPPKRHKLRRPVDGKPLGPTEHQVQSAVIGWWWRAHHGYGLPSFALFAIPNGGARDVITGARLRDEGVRRGTPDLSLAVARGDYHGLYIEMKVGSNRPSEEQRAFLEYLNGAGYKAVVHYSAEDAIKEIQEYLAGPRYDAKLEMEIMRLKA